jgi:hypothetical protein
MPQEALQSCQIHGLPALPTQKLNEWKFQI